MLTSRITVTRADDAPTPEDILSSALAVIYPDDVAGHHGDSDSSVEYASPVARVGRLRLQLADPAAGREHQLFGHYVWNSAVQAAALLEAGRGAWDVGGRAVLELGAGAGLASIVAARMGASRVVAADFPAPALLAVLRANVARNLPPGRCRVVSHEWGRLPECKDKADDNDGDDDDGDMAFARRGRRGFSRVLAADCLWLMAEHGALRRSIAWFLADGADARALVVAAFHTGRATVRRFFEDDDCDGASLAALELAVEEICEVNIDGTERPWVPDRGVEDVGERKRWLVVAVLKRVGGGEGEEKG